MREIPLINHNPVDNGYMNLSNFFGALFPRPTGRPSAIEMTAIYSAPLLLRGWSSSSSRWVLSVCSGPLRGRSVSLSFRPDLTGPSMAFIEDQIGYSENAYIIMAGSENELLRFKFAAIAAGANTTLRVELELERPREMPELLPYSVKAFRYSVHSTERAPREAPLH